MLTVAVIMRASYSATRQRQKDRLIGNLLGCVLAAFSLHVLPDPALVALTFIAIGFSHAYAPVRYRVTSTSACIMALMIMHFSNPGPDRSEEHTSDLQSLMRISSAVLCLKKKNTTNTH